MKLYFDRSISKGYKSPSQIARVLTEDWGKRNLFCASCSRDRLQASPANTNVFDFLCNNCGETYQLKSQRKPFRDKFVDSAYGPMMDSIRSNKAPNLLLLHYNPSGYFAENLVIVPRFFLSASCIEARKPLSGNARRAGWVGCNIVLRQLPPEGRIFIIREGGLVRPHEIRKEFNRFKFLAAKDSESRGWTADVLKVVKGLGKRGFSLDEVYAFENELKELHPQNMHIRPKIRQQLQFLRDKGIVKFSGNGVYEIIP